MSVVEKNRRQQKSSVRLWFNCPDCGMYGATTVQDNDHADDTLAYLDATHACRKARS